MLIRLPVPPPLFVVVDTMVGFGGERSMGLVGSGTVRLVEGGVSMGDFGIIVVIVFDDLVVMRCGRGI